MRTTILSLPFLLFSTLLISSKIHTNVQEQEDKTVYIEIFANQPQPETFYELMDETRAKLDAYGVTLSVLPDIPDLEKTFDQNLAVSVVSKWNSASISSLASSNYELSKSPILYPNFVTPLCCHGGIGILFNAFSLNEKTLNDIAAYIAGIGLYQVGEYKACEQELSKAYDTVSQSSLGRTADGVKSYINFYRANCALMRDDLKLAAELLEESKPSLTGEAAINLAWLWIQLGDSDKAVKIISNLDAGNDWDFLKRRAQLYALAFRYNDAITDLTAAIQLSPHDAALYTLRGQTYLLLYQWDNVLADYNKAIEHDPTYADAYFYRGILKYSVLQTGASLYPEALADFQRYLELVPDGEHAADATHYATDIQTQLAALNN